MGNRSPAAPCENGEYIACGAQTLVAGAIVLAILAVIYLGFARLFGIGLWQIAVAVGAVVGFGIACYVVGYIRADFADDIRQWFQ